MPKPRNPVKSVKITFTTTLQVANLLQQLAMLGMHGRNRAEAAERLVTSGLFQMIERGTLVSTHRQTNVEEGPE